MILFILLILGLPTLELYLLVQVGSEIGAFPAVLLTIFTAVLGAYMVRRQGISTLMRVHRAMDRDEIPALEMMEGAVLLVSGLLLLIPGFFTDAVGFLGLLPPLRRLLLYSLVNKIRVRGDVVRSQEASRQDPRRVIEGEFRREKD